MKNTFPHGHHLAILAAAVVVTLSACGGGEAGESTEPKQGSPRFAQLDLTIAHINDHWKFAIVKPNKGVQLKESDPLHVLYEEGDVYANLRVGTVEKAGVVADYGGLTPSYKPLYNGDKVYGWATPRDLPADPRLKGTK